MPEHTLPVRRGDLAGDGLLRHLAEGAVIVSQRVVPFAHRHYLGDRAGQFTTDRQVSTPQLERLVEAGHVRPQPQDAVWDTIHYVLTERGRAAAAALPDPAAKGSRGKATGGAPR